MVDIIYLDNAASSWPKPPEVSEVMLRAIEEYAANPGRGAHKLSVQAARVIYQTREKLSKLFNIANPNDIIFCANTTGALNLGIKGLLKQGDHVITTCYEHNSVRRPLEYLKKTVGIEITYVQSDEFYCIDPLEIKKEIKENTKLVVVSHASNLIGTIAPVELIGEICKEKNVCFMVDAAQSAGMVPIDVQKMNISLLAFPGHKGLYGPQGTGGLFIHPGIELEPILHGGTGGNSESIDQPSTRPDRYESGTLNTVGIAGLGAGVDFVLRNGIDSIRNKEYKLTCELLGNLRNLEDVIIYGPPCSVERVAVVAFNIKHMDAAEVAYQLDRRFNIAVRAGYHCSPLAHGVLGTMGEGAVRASLGAFNNQGDVIALVEAVRQIILEHR